MYVFGFQNSFIAGNGALTAAVPHLIVGLHSMQTSHVKRIGLFLAAQCACIFLPVTFGQLPDAGLLRFIALVVLISSFVVPLVGYSYVLSSLPVLSQTVPAIRFLAVVGASLVMTLLGYFLLFAILWQVGGSLFPSD